MDRPNQEVLVDLFMQIEHVTEASYGPLPEGVVVEPPENALAFTVRQVIPGDGTWEGRDNTAQIYLPHYLYSFDVNNISIVAQMKSVLAEIKEIGAPTPTFDAEPIIPPVPPPENAG
jgi:hypothetical protein